jgi:Uncharacterized ACR, COG1993
VIVDTAERTEAFLDEVADLVTGGLVIVDDVHVHTGAGLGGGRAASPSVSLPGQRT